MRDDPVLDIIVTLGIFVFLATPLIALVALFVALGW
jgi:hypothetical protein